MCRKRAALVAEGAGMVHVGAKFTAPSSYEGSPSPQSVPPAHVRPGPAGTAADRRRAARRGGAARRSSARARKDPLPTFVAPPAEAAPPAAEALPSGVAPEDVAPTRPSFHD